MRLQLLQGSASFEISHRIARSLGNIWHRLGVPSSVRQALVSQFHVDPKAASNIRCLTRIQKIGGRELTQIRLFDPALLGKDVSKVRRYEDLRGREAAILFEGSMEKGRNVYLVDRRMNHG